LTSGPSVCSIVLTLKQGSRGDQVKCLQTKLNIPADGIFGPITRESVILFQKAHLLAPDGIVGPKTRGELNLAS
jgi:peptidoglycan hydrolase-like protein with peptidoglycan-binding domain